MKLFAQKSKSLINRSYYVNTGSKIQNVEELILATSATVDGKTTSHYIADRFQNIGIKISLLAHGIPVGGELDYLDDGTIGAALKDRRKIDT